MPEFVKQGDDVVMAQQGLATVTLVVEVRNLNNLEKILKSIGKVKGVEKIERYQLGSGPN